MEGFGKFRRVGNLGVLRRLGSLGNFGNFENLGSLGGLGSVGILEAWEALELRRGNNHGQSAPLPLPKALIAHQRVIARNAISSTSIYRTVAKR